MYVIHSCHVWRHSGFQQPFDVGIIHLDAMHTLAGSPPWFTSVQAFSLSYFHHSAEILPDESAVISNFTGPLDT